MTEREWRAEFAKRVISKMIDSGLNQKELAKLANMSEATISRYLKGSRTPSISAVINISKVLNMSILELTWFGEMIK
jgi:transcriptional regulator with XRE-family HTH domain